MRCDARSSTRFNEADLLDNETIIRALALSSAYNCINKDPGFGSNRYARINLYTRATVFIGERSTRSKFERY
jgi:hypothetical protein